jgi:hypothetical protein
MSELFEQVWNLSQSGADGPLASREVAKQYTVHSALHFASEDCRVKAESEDPVSTFSLLYGALLDFRDELQPAVKAPIIPLTVPTKAMARKPAKLHPDVELTNKAA